jgi:peptidoglycan L-alanyl-D-glutamate endopeptidase CwlK
MGTPSQKYFLTQESKRKLEGINPRLAEIVKLAISISDIEFQVLEGTRTRKKHELYYSKGVTQDLSHSTHLYGHAVDLICYIGGRIVLEYEPYLDVAECMKIAATELEVPLTWGGAPQCDDLTKYNGFLQDLTEEYIDLKRGRGRFPLIEAHHFELSIE